MSKSNTSSLILSSIYLIHQADKGITWISKKIKEKKEKKLLNKKVVSLGLKPYNKKEVKLSIKEKIKRSMESKKYYCK